jgi:hypothetical protein
LTLFSFSGASWNESNAAKKKEKSLAYESGGLTLSLFIESHPTKHTETPNIIATNFFTRFSPYNNPDKLERRGHVSIFNIETSRGSVEC